MDVTLCKPQVNGCIAFKFVMEKLKPTLHKSPAICAFSGIKVTVTGNFQHLFSYNLGYKQPSNVIEIKTCALIYVDKKNYNDNCRTVPIFAGFSQFPKSSIK